MTRDDIIQWAKEAGFSLYDLHDVDGQDLGESVEADDFDALVRLAEAVAAAEREACAKVAEDRYFGNPGEFGDEVAAAIRAKKDSA